MIYIPKSQSNNDFRRIYISTFTAITLSLSIIGCSSKKEQGEKPQAVAVKLKTVESATVTDSTEFVGRLEARERVSLAPRIQGRIVKIFARQGDLVIKGQPIVELEPTQQREEVNAASQTVNAEQSRLRQNQAELRTAEANRAVAAAEVESAKANVQDAGSAVELAKINIDRTEMLVKGGALAQQNLDDDRRELQSSIAQLNSQKETLNATVKSLEAAEKQVEGARANIGIQNATIGRVEAELASTSQNLAFNTINAPIDGVVGSFDNKKVGDYVSVGDELTTITNNQNLELNINVPIENRDRLKPGLLVQTVNHDGSKGIEGKITYIAPLIQQSTQSILTKVVFRNQADLKDREYLRVKVIWSEKPGILVPTTAVSTLGGQNFVYVAKPKQASAKKDGRQNTSKEDRAEADSSSEKNSESSSQGEQASSEDVPTGSLIAEQQPVELGSIQTQDYQVISGLKQGDRIAVSNILSLRDGTAISDAAEKKQANSELENRK